MSELNRYALKWIPVKDLSVVWAGAQRKFDAAWAKQIADAFDPDLFGVLSVCPDGKPDIYHTIDGQHRKAAVQSLYGDNEQVPCRVFDTTDPARAAEMFDRINTARKKPHPVDLFNVRVKAGYEDEVTINRIVKSLGYKVRLNVA